MKEYMQYIMLGAVILSTYLAYMLNKQAQETNTTVMEILKEKKEVVCITLLLVFGILFLMNKGEEGLNLFGQDKLCTTEFYDQP